MDEKCLVSAYLNILWLNTVRNDLKLTGPVKVEVKAHVKLYTHGYYYVHVNIKMQYAQTN